MVQLRQNTLFNVCLIVKTSIQNPTSNQSRWCHIKSRIIDLYRFRRSPPPEPFGDLDGRPLFDGNLLAGDDATINGDGLQTRDYIHVSDVVRANLAAVGRPGFQVVNVGTGRETNVVELYVLLSAALGVDREPINGPGKPGEQRRSAIDPTRLAGELGVRDLLGLEDGLKRTAAWFAARRS